MFQNSKKAGASRPAGTRISSWNLVILVLVFGGGLVLPGNAVAQKKPDEKDPLKQKGVIQEISEQVGSLVAVEWKDGQLAFGTRNSYEEIDPVVDSIREVVGWGGGSSYGSNDGFEFELTAEKIDGYIKREKQSKKFVTSIHVNELIEPWRTLHISVRDDGMFQINIFGNRSAFMMRTRQYPDGRFVVQELNGTSVFARSAVNFDAFCRQNRQYVGDRLMPMFQQFGMGQILTPYTPAIQDGVAEMVTPWQPRDLNRIDELTRSLNSEVYEERIVAYEELEGNLKGNESLLARMIYDSQFPPESRASARALIHEHTDDDQLMILEFVDRMASSLDADYLVDLIELQPDADKRKFLIHRLREVSPQFADSGESDDELVSMVTSQVRKKWASLAGKEPENEPEIDVLSEKGHFQGISMHTGRLIKLIWHEDALSVDREHWKEPFDGQRISEITAEIKKLVREKNLPEDWFNAGGPEFSAASAQHPQVLFEKLEEQCGGDESSNHYHMYGYGGGEGTATPNRLFDHTKMKGELNFNKAGERRNHEVSSGSLAKKPLLISLSEKSGPQRMLLIEEEKRGEFRLMITGERSNFIVQLVLKKDSAIVQDVRGNQILAYEASSFRELQQQQPGYFRDSFFPLLRHLGVLISPDIDAGADASETTMQQNARSFADN